jgi:translation initiation factor IF-3
MMRRGGSGRRSPQPEDGTRVNTQIRVPEVLVIGPEGEQIGILPTREALAQAEEQGYDLVEVAPGAKPPVCRMMDYGRYRYQLQKKQKANQKASGGNELKELRMRPNTEKHDFDVKMKAAHEFLSEGNRLKLTVRFRGRELAHREIGRAILEQAVEALSEVGKIDGWIADEGRNMTVNIIPTKGGTTKSDSDS